MLHWMALLPGVQNSLDIGFEGSQERGPVNEHEHNAAVPSEMAPEAFAALSTLHLAWWCLQFTPRVALLKDAVVLEIQASERLFGGRLALRQRIAQGASALGVQAWAHAGTALAAYALVRLAQMACDTRDSTDQAHEHLCTDDDADTADEEAAMQDLAHALDPLPLTALPGVAEHEPTLARLGCQTLAQVRALPRGGLSRRFGAGLLHALDQAYGQRPEAFEWLTLPPVFDARLELPGRVENAPALLFAANRLLQQLCAWLAGRHAGVTAFTLRWQHDWHRQDTSREGARTIRLASPSRDLNRLSRLLAEHLQRIQLSAPVGDISLHADEIEALPLGNCNLFQELNEDRLSAQPDALITPAAQRAQHDALLALLDKLSVRLGSERVLQGRVQADHRLECAQTWHPAIQLLPARPTSTSAHHQPSHKPSHKPVPETSVAGTPQPSWILPEPMPLALANDGPGLREHPIYQGKLSLLAGPHRIEAGWWDANPSHGPVARDYYLASSEHAGLLWIYKARHATDDPRSPWYLHGFFA